MKGSVNHAKKLQNITGFTSTEELKRLNFILEELNAVLKNNPTKKVLEIGCGNGNVSYGIASMGYQTLGIDIDAKSIEKASQNSPFDNLRFKAIAAEEMKDEGMFDAIVCTEVLEHLQDPTVVIKYAFDHLKDEGVFVSTVPNGYGPRELLMTQPMQYLEKKNLGGYLYKVKKVFGFGDGTVQSSNPDLEHVQFFTKSKIVSLHTKHGFEMKRFSKGECFNNVFPISIFNRRIKALEKLDCRMANILPAPFSSIFYMTYAKAQT